MKVQRLDVSDKGIGMFEWEVIVYKFINKFVCLFF